MTDTVQVWRRCSRCKAAINCGATYLVCSVSSCNRARSGMVFCSMDCWDAHVPVARHREASAEECTAPATPDAPAEGPEREDQAPGVGQGGRGSPRDGKEKVGKRRIVPAKQRDPSLPKDMLVVSKALKAYVEAAGGLRTSDAVLEVLSEKLRDLCDRAIERAKAEERKTLLDRDFLPK